MYVFLSSIWVTFNPTAGQLSSLHPIISYTLGPSTIFSCPAVSRFTVEESQNICTTYAVIESSLDVSVDERGRTIWAWRGSMSNTLDRSAQKKSSVVVSIFTVLSETRRF
jgi:hypothetical protein